MGTEHDPADAERDAAIASVAGDPEALQALVQRFDGSVGSLLETRTAVAPTAGSERQRDRETERQRDRETERQRDRETERQRDRETERRDREGAHGRRMVAGAPSPCPLRTRSPRPAKQQPAASPRGSRAIWSRRKYKATAVAASRARQAEKQQQLVLAPKVSKGRRRMGSASGVDALATPLEHRRC
eukprot:COSAG03_NODE_3548_length_1955_cov_6.040948_2_plen_187_part_00